MKRIIALFLVIMFIPLVSCGEAEPELSRADHVYSCTELEAEPDELSSAVRFDGGTLELCENRLVLEKDGEKTEILSDATSVFDSPVRRVTSLAVSDGRIYLLGGTSIAVIDGDNVSASKLPGSDAEIFSSGGEVFVSYLDPDYSRTVRKVGTDGKPGEKLTLPPETVFSRADIFVAPGHEVYLSTEDGLWASDGGEAELLCDYINSDIDVRSVVKLAVESEDCFYAALREAAADEYVTSYYRFDRLDESEIPEKYIIRVAGSGASDELRSAIIRFNRKNTSVRAQLDDYSKYNTPDDPTRGAVKLRYDIVAGKIPDVMIFTRDDERFGYKRAYVKAKMFADLYGFIDSDPDLSRGDLISAATVNAEKDGKLYELISDFSLRTMFSDGKSGHYTLSSLIDDVGERSVNPFTYSGDFLLYNLLTLSMDEFVTDRGCDFDKEDFRRLLSMIKNFRDSGEEEFRILDLDEYNLISDFVRLAAGRELDGFTGLPAGNGNGTAIFVNESFSIYSKSALKDESWELIKEIFVGGRPMTLKSSLREKLSEYIGDRYAVSEKGSLTGLTDGMDPPAGKLLFVFGEEHADKLFGLIDDASRGYDYLDPVMSIVLEEASAYFSGAKTVDETIGLINDRVSTFISENR